MRLCQKIGVALCALTLLVAVAGRAGVGKIVCVVSGGNIDGSKIRQILAGNVP